MKSRVALIFTKKTPGGNTRTPQLYSEFEFYAKLTPEAQATTNR